MNGEKTEIASPTVLLVTAGNFHSTHVNANSGAFVYKISFTDAMISDYFEAKLKFPLILKNYTAHGELTGILEKFKGASVEEEKKIIINFFILSLINIAEPSLEVAQMGLNNHIISATDIINRKFSEPLTLTEVAKALSVTPQYLSALFKCCLSISFSDYLSDIRLRYAAGLLTEEKMSVTDICYLSGYRNLSHFIRKFKSKYGVSPKIYKGKMRNEKAYF